MQNKAEQDRNQEATVYLGNLDERASDALVWELMLQAGPVSNVFLPKDRISMTHQGFGFCEFMAEQDADYCVKIMNQIKLYGKPIRVTKASYDKKQLDVGANLFIGNLDDSVEESQLYDTFSTFGTIAEHPKIARDPSTGASKGYGFVSYHDFDAADMAIENMNGQFFGGKQITIQYAFKKDGKGERHGTQAERLLAAQAKKQSFIPGGPTGPGFSYQGQFAGALAAQAAQAAQANQSQQQHHQNQQHQHQQQPPAPPPGIPVYQPPIPQNQPPQQYGYPPQQGGYPGQGGPPQPPQGFPQSNGNYPSYPPPPAGFPVANGYPQQGGFQPPVPGGAPPPPIRLGFDGPPQQR